MTRRPPDQHKFGRRLRRWEAAEVQARESKTMRLRPFEVWRSRDFLVQLFSEDGFVRITVNRTHQPNGKDWADGISWDDLQAIKAEIGRGEAWAVELFPAEGDVVNEANMRHLWLLSGPPPFGWHSRAAHSQNRAEGES